MKLFFDGDVPVYSPAVGVNLVPGEAEYADALTDQLLAAGLKKPKAKAAPAVPKEGKSE